MAYVYNENHEKKWPIIYLFSRDSISTIVLVGFGAPSFTKHFRQKKVYLYRSTRRAVSTYSFMRPILPTLTGHTITKSNNNNNNNSSSSSNIRQDTHNKRAHNTLMTQPSDFVSPQNEFHSFRAQMG